MLPHPHKLSIKLLRDYVLHIQGMEKRYGKQSDKMDVAAGLVKQVILESSDALVKLYNGRVLVQALVLEWDYP